MTITELLNTLFPSTGSFQIAPDKERIISHPQGPAWVLAGPGSGKTEVLTVLALRLLYVEGDPAQSKRVAPESILITTFTEKAARNLEDRIAQKRAVVVAARPELESIDVSKLRVGTLHGLCNDLLQEFRAPNYQNVRLMDEFEQSLFIYEQSSIVKTPNPPTDLPFWTDFEYLFSAREWKSTYGNVPSKWAATGALMKLFNRVVEDRVSMPAMRAKGGSWARLADLYDEYVAALLAEHRCDFAHLQLRFLEFLQSPLGQHFRDGNATQGQPGVQWVLVDEYQDTNLIQEEIYLTLAKRKPYNVVVVGDDDQALYRFRGGSVECMVTFDQACHAFLGVMPVSVATFPMTDNFRSHPAVVTFCNDYITAFPAMKTKGARVPGKPPLIPASNISGNYRAVGQLRAAKTGGLAARFAELVDDLVANRIVQDYSQCCLLLRSAKESPQNALPYVSALQARGISVYNPRNKAFLEQEEVLGLLGAIFAVLDPAGRNVPSDPRNPRAFQVIRDFVAGCQAQYAQMVATNAALRKYVDGCQKSLANHPGEYLTASLQDVVYYLLALPPFDSWQADPVRRVRMARLTALFEAFVSMPVPGKPNLSRGSLRASSANPGEVVDGWSRSFYHLFIGYLSRAGLDEAEDEDEICPPGRVPIMTMHQSKGLQFPFVFVGHMGQNWEASATHRLETEFGQFPGNPARAFPRLPEDTRAELDLIRQYYVAYSRAEYALILMGTNQQFSKGAVPCGPTTSWLSNKVLPI
jgi:DNA helicase II / ATP-dependent DNA helicase PcrA